MYYNPFKWHRNRLILIKICYCYIYMKFNGGRLSYHTHKDQVSCNIQSYRYQVKWRKSEILTNLYSCWNKSRSTKVILQSSVICRLVCLDIFKFLSVNTLHLSNRSWKRSMTWLIFWFLRRLKKKFYRSYTINWNWFIFSV